MKGAVFASEPLADHLGVGVNQDGHRIPRLCRQTIGATPIDP
jgi:hypothetical protein